MNKYTYTLGTLFLSMIIGVLPSVTFANNSTSGEGEGGMNARIQSQVHIELENSTTSARSFEELKVKIEQRQQELDEEEASSTDEDKDIVKRVNPVRLAVHTLLDSKALLGGIGEQVSKIAREMNDSAATTTQIEAKIKSRGFLIRFFFGGDKMSAGIISKETDKNQKRIEEITKLLEQANISADLKVELNAQITALENANIRLQVLAQKERGAWGIFSWRFSEK